MMKKASLVILLLVAVGSCYGAILLDRNNNAALEILRTEDARRIYTDSGTGADMDLAVFEPNRPNGYYMTGHFAQRNHNGALDCYGEFYLVKPLQAGALVQPQGFTQMWNDKGSGGNQDVSFWRVDCPGGYASLGDVIHANSYSSPNYLLSQYACIRYDLATSSATCGGLLWWDKGSGADHDGSMWWVKPPAGYRTGYFRVQNGYDEVPDNRFYWFSQPLEE